MNGFVISWITVDKHVVFENAIAHIARSFRRRRRKHAKNGLCQIHLISDKEWNSDVAVVTNSYECHKYYDGIRLCDCWYTWVPDCKITLTGRSKVQNLLNHKLHSNSVQQTPVPLDENRASKSSTHPNGGEEPEQTFPAQLISKGEVVRLEKIRENVVAPVFNV